VSYSHALNLLTLSHRLLKTVIKFCLFCGTRLSFLTHSSTTPVLHPNINLLFLKRIHPLLFIHIHSFTHPYLSTLTLTRNKSLSFISMYLSLTHTLLSLTRSTHFADPHSSAVTYSHLTHTHLLSPTLASPTLICCHLLSPHPHSSAVTYSRLTNTHLLSHTLASPPLICCHLLSPHPHSSAVTYSRLFSRIHHSQTCFNYQLDAQFLYSVIYVLH
jgi:hypothetical protein